MNVMRHVLAAIMCTTIAAGGGACARCETPAAAPETRRVAVVATAAGFGAEEVARHVALPLEHALATVPGVVSVESASTTGLMRLVVVASGPLPAVRQAVHERLASVSASLPASVWPALGPVTNADEGVARYVLSSEELTLAELTSLADWHVRPHLLTIPGVAGIATCGGRAREVHIELDPERMRARAVTLTSVRRAIGAANEGAGGRIEAGGEWVVRGIGDDAFGALERLEVAVIEMRDGAPVLLRDVAVVKTGQVAASCHATRDGREVLLGAVLLQADADAAAVRARVERAVEELRPSLPSGVRLDLERAATQRIRLALPATRSDDERRRLVARAAAALASLSEVMHVTTSLGISDGDLREGLPEVLDIRVELRTELPRADLLRPLDVVAELGQLLPEGDPPMHLRLFGPDRAELQRLARAVEDLARSVSGIGRTFVLGAGSAPTLSVELDAEALARHGLMAADVHQHLAAAGGGLLVGELLEGGRRTAIRLRLPSDASTAMTALLLPGPGNTAVPLGQVARLEQRQAPTLLLSEGGRRFVELQLEATDPAARETLRARLSAFALPPGYALRWNE